MKKSFQFLILGIISIIITVVILNMVYVVKVADTYAMNPTIRINDIVLFRRTNDKVRRFDIVLLNQNSKYSIVRVIGLPGENILYQNDVLYVDGKEQIEPFINYEKNNSQLFGGLYTMNFSTMTISSKSQIPDDNFLVLFDNRFMDNDSRTYGLVDRKNIIGVHRGTL